VSGETGTGKELVARAIHDESPRSAGPFVSINCASLPGELLEAELFGYRKGAFTGADEDRPGLLAGAARGTVFLDEVGEMPLGLQAKLLRALDQGRVRPVGGSAEVDLDARFVFATNRDLQALVDERGFRSDLYFRLSAFEIRMPPLRSRLEDLPLLVNHFRGAAAAGREAPTFDEGAFRALAAHPWPGNIRELKNVVTRLVLTQASRVSAADVNALLGRSAAETPVFPPALLRGHALADLHAILDREYLIQLHAERGGNVRALAASLGIKVRALYKRFQTLGIRPRDLR
jgi:DNA-binding NtrC family response regulator